MAETAVAPADELDALRRPRSCGELFRVFNRLALQGFGGVLPVAHRALVERERWQSPQQFVELLTLSQVLGASPAEISALFLWFGAIGLAGNLLLTRHIDRIGADRAVALTLGCMAVSLLLWPLGSSVALMMLVSMPWALGCFASNAGQQARLVQAAPVLAPALIALNSSAMFAGQALGAASGGAVMAQGGYGPLHWMGLGWMLGALALSLWAARQMLRQMLRQKAQQAPTQARGG